MSRLYDALETATSGPGANSYSPDQVHSLLGPGSVEPSSPTAAQPNTHVPEEDHAPAGPVGGHGHQHDHDHNLSEGAALTQFMNRLAAVEMRPGEMSPRSETTAGVQLPAGWRRNPRSIIQQQRYGALPGGSTASWSGQARAWQTENRGGMRHGAMAHARELYIQVAMNRPDLMNQLDPNQRIRQALNGSEVVRNRDQVAQTNHRGDLRMMHTDQVNNPAQALADAGIGQAKQAGQSVVRQVEHAAVQKVTHGFEHRLAQYAGVIGMVG